MRRRRRKREIESVVAVVCRWKEREEKERRLSPSEGYVISAYALVGRLSVAGTTYLTHCP